MPVKFPKFRRSPATIPAGLDSKLFRIDAIFNAYLSVPIEKGSALTMGESFDYPQAFTVSYQKAGKENLRDRSNTMIREEVALYEKSARWVRWLLYYFSPTMKKKIALVKIFEASTYEGPLEGLIPRLEACCADLGPTFRRELSVLIEALKAEEHSSQILILNLQRELPKTDEQLENRRGSVSPSAEALPISSTVFSETNGSERDSLSDNAPLSSDNPLKEPLLTDRALVLSRSFQPLPPSSVETALFLDVEVRCPITPTIADHCVLLGLEKEDFSFDELRKAYKLKAPLFHPDKGCQDGAGFLNLSRAYETLQHALTEEKNARTLDQLSDNQFSAYWRKKVTHWWQHYATPSEASEAMDKAYKRRRDQQTKRYVEPLAEMASLTEVSRKIAESSAKTSERMTAATHLTQAKIDGMVNDFDEWARRSGKEFHASMRAEIQARQVGRSFNLSFLERSLSTIPLLRAWGMFAPTKALVPRRLLPTLPLMTCS